MATHYLVAITYEVSLHSQIDTKSTLFPPNARTFLLPQIEAVRRDRTFLEWVVGHR